MSFADLNEPDSLEGGILAALPAGFPQGKQFIIMEEWGPYNFRRPVAVMDTIAGNLISLTLLGPSGDWKITGMKGVKSVTAQKGIIPEALIVERDPNVPGCSIQFSYNGPETVTTAFGEKVPPGSNYPFEFRFFDQKLDWKMQFYNYNTETGIPDMAALLSGKPVLEQQTNELWMAWWGAPAPGVNADQFATVSTSRFTIPKGKYTFTLTSDDGVRLYLDGKLLLDRWDIHEPATDRLEVELNGQHDLRIEHFDATGFGTLDFRISE